MRIFASLIILFFTVPLLSACGFWGDDEPDTSLLPSPAESGINDPDDAALTEAIRHFVQTAQAPAATGYNYVRYDLNDDGRRDALVYLKSPYGYWCGLHGCVMLVFRAHNEHFTLINAIQPIRNPVYISVMKSHGWKNLVVRVSGRSNKKAKDVAILYDGQQYPSDPSKLPPFPKKNYNGYTRAFMKD